MGLVGQTNEARLRWASWRINGCGRARSRNVIHGYFMSADRSIAPYLPEADDLIACVQIPGVLRAVRLFWLGPHSYLGFHQDEGELYWGCPWWDVYKIHVPIVTNPSCNNLYLLREGEVRRIHMGTGEYWAQDGTVPHGAENLGDQGRWHLVLDIQPPRSAGGHAQQ